MHLPWKRNQIYKPDDFWLQKVSYKIENDRVKFFKSLCENKKVIHFGCTDWPVFNPENNLHIKLNQYAKVLHGFDIDLKGIEILKNYVDQKYYSDFNYLKDEEYDICLIPETIEHVENIATFLRDVSAKVNAKAFYITGPNCFATAHITRNIVTKDTFTEIVHPDHNCWFSPFTLKNSINKYSSLEVNQVYLLENETMVCCEAFKKK